MIFDITKLELNKDEITNLISSLSKDLKFDVTVTSSDDTFIIIRDNVDNYVDLNLYLTNITKINRVSQIKELINYYYL